MSFLVGLEREVQTFFSAKPIKKLRLNARVNVKQQSSGKISFTSGAQVFVFPCISPNVDFFHKRARFNIFKDNKLNSIIVLLFFSENIVALLKYSVCSYVHNN